MKSDPLRGFRFILILLANAVSSTKIENLVVPEVAQSGTDVILYCQYHVSNDDYVFKLLFNGNKTTSVYKWSPQHKTPEVMGILEEYLDIYFTSSRTPGLAEGRALRLVGVEPQLSGEYTCVIESKGIVTRETKSMLVYSTEQDLDLIINAINQGVVNIACVARGVYPQPDLILEYHNKPISQQYQRVWRDKDLLFVIESTTQLTVPKCRETTNIEVKCRLSLPQADYIAIKKRYLLLEADECNSARNENPSKLNILSIVLLITSSIRETIDS